MDNGVVERAEGVDGSANVFVEDEFLFYLASISADFLNVDHID